MEILAERTSQSRTPARKPAGVFRVRAPAQARRGRGVRMRLAQGSRAPAPSRGQFGCETRRARDAEWRPERGGLSRGRAAEPSPCRGWCSSAGAGPSPATTWSSRGCSSCACECSGEGVGLCVRAAGRRRERARGCWRADGGAAVSSGYSSVQSLPCVRLSSPLPGRPARLPR